MVRDSGRERPFALESSRTFGYDDPLEPGIWEMSVNCSRKNVYSALANTA